MKLTTEQQKLVEQNHNLIYWYINMHHLEISEWYDLLAIELCYTAMNYDAEKGAFSTYFKKRANWKRAKEYRKASTQKRSFQGVTYIEGLHNVENQTSIEDIIEIQDWIGEDITDVLLHKSRGFNQSEIGDILGVSQTHVSKTLKRLKGEFTLDR
jgi:RNA polymerase sigma factor (sigma-70 family)